MIFVVLKLDESIISYQRQVWVIVVLYLLHSHSRQKTSSQSEPIAPKIDASTVYLSFTHNIEVMDFKLVTDIAEYLATISKTLMNQPYLQPKSDIGHVAKYVTSIISFLLFLLLLIAMNHYVFCNRRSVKRPPGMTDAEFEQHEVKP